VNNVLSRCHFVALNLDLLHKHGPEDTTVGSVSFKQENHIEKLDGDICRLQQKIENFNLSVNDQLSKLNTRFVADSVPVRQRTHDRPMPDINRSMNIIVFGVNENRDSEM